MASNLRGDGPHELHSYRTPQDVNCGGGTTPAHWTSYATCSDGHVICGLGDTQTEAEDAVRRGVAKHHAFLAQSPQDRLREVLSHASDSRQLLSVDVTLAIKAIAEILLKMAPS